MGTATQIQIAALEYRVEKLTARLNEAEEKLHYAEKNLTHLNNINLNQIKINETLTVLINQLQKEIWK